MRTYRAVLRLCVLCCAGGLTGCGVSTSPQGTAKNDQERTFMSISISDFSSARAIPVYLDTVTSQATDVVLPEDLFETAPLEAIMVLPSPSVTVNDDAPSAPGQNNPAAQGIERRVTVLIRIAPPDSDACASSVQIGPFEVILIDGAVTLASQSLPLSPAAQALIRSGRFAICAQVTGDFGGSVVVGDLKLEFGRLRENEKSVELCHLPPGNPENRHTITVGAPAVDAHLDHGDYLGPCRDLVTELTLTSDCSDDPDTQRQWGIDNPNDFALEVAWVLAGIEQTGTVTASPGQTQFLTDTVPDVNTVTISWHDEIGVQQSATEDSTGQRCVVDSDGDGLLDDIDACPGTPTGEPIDPAGCSCSQLDADSDGVDDCDDLCPDTPTATNVSTNGCPSDDVDDDGVPDGQDACPNTPPGEAVDPSGCSCSQLDADGDAVTDCDDLCPNTPTGVPVDGFGCEVTVVDAGPDVTLDEAGLVTLQGSASGGTPPYTYFWSATGWEGAAGQSATALVTQTTTFTLAVTDWSFPPQTVTDTVTVTMTTRDDLQYTIIDLGSLSSNSSYPSGVNNLGEVVGYFFTDTWQKRAFMYSAGTMIDLGTLGGSEAWAYDINSAGQVVGEARTASGDWHAFLWDATNGMKDLGTLGGTTSVGYAVNELGQVAGYSTVGSVIHAFLYSDDAIGDLGTFDYHQSGAFDINDQSQIVGLLLPLTSTAGAFVYQDGALTDLGALTLTNSEAWLINNAGLVAGHSWESSVYRSFLYANGMVADLGVLDGFANIFVWGLSETGLSVGSMTDASGTLARAFVYTGGELRNLDDLLVTDHGWDFLTTANAVNDNGQIVGYGRINGAFSGFMLTPVP